MNQLNLSNNITRLRHARKLTQEELADFLGVTKASVSKWENAQSVPDLLLLPQLAAFFGVSIDELVGYEAQLSREQIRRRYAELSEDFVKLPFSEVLEKIRSLAHQYYSCYPFLLQLSVLYLNHFMLAGTKEERKELLQEAAAWCERILEHCSDVGVCSDALVVKAGLHLQLGRVTEVIEALEPVSDPNRIAGQSETLLIQAYQMAGEAKNAKIHAQAKQYVSLLDLVGNAILLLALYETDLERCEETIRRTRGMIELYQLERLHPNLTAQFYLQTAMVYAANEKRREALDALGSFEQCVRELLHTETIVLHGDAYFDLLDLWIDRLALGNMAPRDKSFIPQSIQAALSHPAFKGMREEKEFQRLVCRLTEYPA